MVHNMDLYVGSWFTTWTICRFMVHNMDLYVGSWFTTWTICRFMVQNILILRPPPKNDAKT